MWNPLFGTPTLGVEARKPVCRNGFGGIPRPRGTETTSITQPEHRGMSHTDYTVGPKPGDRTGWKVEANGRVVSRHNKKRTALEEAKRRADRNDSITVQNARGQFQKRL